MKILSITPSPFNESLNINWFNPYNQQISVRIKDINGNDIAVLSNSYYNSGNNNINWKPKIDIASGIYLIVISDEFQTVSQKVIYYK